MPELNVVDERPVIDRGDRPTGTQRLAQEAYSYSDSRTAQPKSHWNDCRMVLPNMDDILNLLAEIEGMESATRRRSYRDMNEKQNSEKKEVDGPDTQEGKTEYKKDGKQYVKEDVKPQVKEDVKPAKEDLKPEAKQDGKSEANEEVKQAVSAPTQDSTPADPFDIKSFGRFARSYNSIVQEAALKALRPLGASNPLPATK